MQNSTNLSKVEADPLVRFNYSQSRSNIIGPDFACGWGRLKYSWSQSTDTRLDDSTEIKTDHIYSNTLKYDQHRFTGTSTTTHDHSSQAEIHHFTPPPPHGNMLVLHISNCSKYGRNDISVLTRNSTGHHSSHFRRQHLVTLSVQTYVYIIIISIFVTCLISIKQILAYE